MTLIEKLSARVKAVDSYVCVGLDSDLGKITGSQFDFNKAIIEATHAYAAAYKPNLAFYEARGAEGWAALAETMSYLHEHYPDIVTIADAKRADIGTTNEGYVAALFDRLGFDAVTLHPYLGSEALSPFLSREDKGSFILCRTSNPGAGEFQDLVVDGKPLWQVVAEKVAREWNSRGNCGLVVGATYPEELSVVRQMVGEIPLLVPGVGAQGGEVAAAVKAGKGTTAASMLINSSRGIIFSPDPGASAKTLRDEINQELSTK